MSTKILLHVWCTLSQCFCPSFFNSILVKVPDNMPPRTDFVPKSSLGIVPPASRNSSRHLTNDIWLEEKKDTDGADGLWRIHDEIYDLSEFINKHPGGSEWISMTKGTDITEAFEVHHITELPKEMLKKYYVNDAKTERNSPFTFNDDGFYRTLKREIVPMLKSIPKQSYKNSNFFADSLLVLTYIFSIFAIKYWSFGIGIMAGLLLGMLTVASHNYIHMKDNFRMYYIQTSLTNVRDWRISHALSHHLYTNTISDLEISALEPLMNFLPVERTTFQRYLSLIVSPFFWMTFVPSPTVFRLIHAPKYKFQNLRLTDLFSLVLPTCIYIFGGQSVLSTFVMWNFIILTGSTYLGFVGLHAGHHHPEVFHDGDAVRPAPYDWGIGQLDALMDRKEISGSHFLVLTNFGDHALHHFFPTLDHGVLKYLYPTFNKVCKQFDVDLRMVSQLETIKGSVQQLLRTKPNSSPPDLKKYSKKDT